MTEDVRNWWSRRSRTRAADPPYAIGAFRREWRSFPVLIRMFHPDLNRGVTLSQIPPAADVYLVWQCDSGHVFVATPEEQRMRPGRERRRSAWCPVCSAEASGATPERALVRAFSSAGMTVAEWQDAVRSRGPSASRSATPVDPAADPARSARARPAPTSRRRTPRLCTLTPALDPGTPFESGCAPPPASAVEARLRAALAARLEFEPRLNAVRLSRPFFEHLEAWPDIPLGDLRVAIEWDSTGRHGLEHVGRREAADRRKDRALRAVGWEVIRIRSSELPLLGPYDFAAASAGPKTVERVLDALRTIRGDLFVNAYLR